MRLFELLEFPSSRAAAVGWEPERPDEKSLWLLPSGSDQVGDDAVRPTPGRPYGGAGQNWQAAEWIASLRSQWRL